jgi:hypothetical protein
VKYTFDVRCRQRGRKWLKENPEYSRPEDYWSEFEGELREGFGGLCGYCAMMILKGQMDHFIPVAEFKKKKQDELAYEWSNFRYVEAVFNQRKSDHMVLDPFKVKNAWFEILLPSLQLVLTDKVPKSKRKLAEFTLIKLGLRDGEVVVRLRSAWFEHYRRREWTLEAMRKNAPLIAMAIERDLANGTDWRYAPN